MTAIVSTAFRLFNSTRFLSEVVAENDKVYIGIGKSDAWGEELGSTDDSVVPSPTDAPSYFSDAYNDLIGMNKVAPNKISHMIPKREWTGSQEDWVAWDSTDPTIFDQKFYCLTDDNHVYKLIRRGSGSSTEKPTHTTADVDEETDGYAWKFMYTVEQGERDSFITDNYMPVQTDTSGSGDRYNLQEENAGNGSFAFSQGIEQINIVSGGTGYTEGGTTLTIEGDGNGATAEVVVGVSGTAITGITITNAGSDYTYANVIIAGDGTNAKLVPVIAPGSGHGTDPVSELGGFYVGLNVTLSGDGGGDLTVGNDFRQISVIQNPLEFDQQTPCDATTYQTVRRLETDVEGDATYQGDDVITGDQTGAIGIVVRSNSDTGHIYYVQNSTTGFTAFNASEEITSTAIPSPTTLSATIDPEISYNSGDVLFLDNRSPIVRSGNQTEDIKIIIEF